VAKDGMEAAMVEGSEGSVVYMGRASFRMEVAPFDGHGDGNVSPMESVPTEPLDATAPASGGGQATDDDADGDRDRDRDEDNNVDAVAGADEQAAQPLFEMRDDFTQKLAVSVSMSRGVLAGVGALAFACGLLAASIFGGQSRVARAAGAGGASASATAAPSPIVHAEIVALPRIVAKPGEAPETAAADRPAPRPRTRLPAPRLLPRIEGAAQGPTARQSVTVTAHWADPFAN
jgi:hypothetical protein